MADLSRHHLAFGTATAWPVAVTIPARNEAERITACLDAAAASLRGRGGIVVVVNGSHDDTFTRTVDWFRSSGASGIVVDDRSPPADSGVGRARRIAVNACRSRLSQRAAVMVSDADSRVARDWVDANLSELGRADLVCGTVLPDPEEAAILPAEIANSGSLEGEYMALTIAARCLLDPVPWDPEPTHLNAAGASLALRLSHYEALGGFADLRCGEDRALADLAERCGFRVRHSARVQVTTTCRLDGRAPGGMADALSSRIKDANPLVDELLEPAAQTILRNRLRGDLRQRMAHRDFTRTWATVEAGRADLRRTRMRLSDLRRELPLLATALGAQPPLPERQIA
ncbi:glycosyltransferase [Tepidamorphus sp. 3E244]|uniref:glycosyltransferase n=1 Tax=Tepidamorphus sp. 3E244 TaxID=3385498 RepID=UPI0038FC4266